jgi:hypothetical protein
VSCCRAHERTARIDRRPVSASVISPSVPTAAISPSCGGHRGCDSQQDERRAPGRRSTIGSRRSPSGRASGTGSGCGPRWLSAWPPSRLGVHTTAAHRAMFRGSESSHFLIDWSIDSESAPARVVAVGESGGPVEPTIGQLDFGPVLRSVAVHGGDCNDRPAHPRARSAIPGRAAERGGRGAPRDPGAAEGTLPGSPDRHPAPPPAATHKERISLGGGLIPVTGPSGTLQRVDLRRP